MNKTLTTAAAALALVAFPVAAADAKPGKGHGHGNGHGPSHAPAFEPAAPVAAPALDDTTSTEPPVVDPPVVDPPVVEEPKPVARKCKKVRKVGFSVRGSLASFTAEDVTVTVARANKHARSFIQGDTHTFTLAGARVKFEGVTGFEEVVATDVVKVTGKVALPKRGCAAGDPALLVRKVHVERPEADETTDEG